MSNLGVVAEFVTNEENQLLMYMILVAAVSEIILYKIERR